MRVLLVCKGDFEISEENFEKKRAYIFDQYKGLKKHGFHVDLFFIRGSGIATYLKAISKLRAFLKKNNYDIIHAHYGYCGLVAGLVSPFPVVVTYHGTDLTESLSRIISCVSVWLASWNIFVSKRLFERVIPSPKSRYSILPCGVDLDVFFPKSKIQASDELGWDPKIQRVVFSSSFDNPVKNFPLAKSALDMIPGVGFDLVELKDKSRKEVALILNASDVLLLTSHTEGSPQIIKEALACGCPIVSVDVGDVKERIAGVQNCFLVEKDPKQIAAALTRALQFEVARKGPLLSKKLDNKLVIKELSEIYHSVASKSTNSLNP
jgi:glycosyltransferase involved in cell wall biosynthesis